MKAWVLCLFVGVVLARKLETTSPINLPITYYSKGQLTAQTLPNGVIGYAMVTQCVNSVGAKTFAQLDIIVAGYPFINLNEKFVVLELSYCDGIWNESCTFATNYVWGDAAPEAVYNNITWVFESEFPNVYIRYISYYQILPFTITLTYTDDAIVNIGKPDPDVFQDIASKNGNYYYLSQYIRSSFSFQTGYTVEQLFSFSFCNYDPPCNKDYQLTITVRSTSDYSAFDVVGCPALAVPNYANCLVTNGNQNVVKNQDAAAIVQITMQSTANLDLSYGVWLGVYGEGAPLNGQNSFMIDIVAT